MKVKVSISVPTTAENANREPPTANINGKSVYLRLSVEDYNGTDYYEGEVDV